MTAAAPADVPTLRLRLQGGVAATTEHAAATAAQVIGFGTHVDATIGWAVSIGHQVPVPGKGKTTALWELLATTAALDVAAARILEPHLDALAILAQARAEGDDPRDALTAIGADGHASWGVFAAEGPGGRVEAARAPDGGWTLTGVKPWCSLATYLSHALVTAWDGDRRRLFAVALRQPAVVARSGPWHARGLSHIVSAPVEFEGAAAVPIGGPDWYLTRPGFAWGGMGVAAVWWGGAMPLVDALAAATARAEPDQLSLAFLGEADTLMWATRASLAESAHAVDGGMDAAAAKVLAERVRATAAAAAERVLTIAEHALGPAPLTAEEKHARRVADLRLYLRQHHGERDLARLGRLLGSR
ncbi:acyl-CoA dehydrogenase [Microbacterium terricola]|uniref:Acyl-CoA dehydrogenase n=1 Tax=Microbacterium terricola TaxID=344163 RepID=A0ABM8DVB2_9MICO|nr:acyl-CoA dehydrogenase [Microbacterium terricola]UYK39641.1 acyl-CoA dehydrogenase [Microbacterium terricola]BDV29618.1 acyl-CoA dehydrogenase [Microbacterium terricola]